MSERPYMFQSHGVSPWPEPIPVTSEYDPDTGLTWITIHGPVTNCTRCNRMLAGAEPFLCDDCQPTDADLMGAYGG